MKQTFIFLSLLLFASTSFAQITSAGSGSCKSATEILDENGKIKSGVNGSYNATGYSLDYGENKEPIFKKSNPIQKASTITWYALGSSVGDWVYAIAVSGSEVYVGGGFTVAGGNPANYIAKWNGSSWSALGSGVGSTVRAIAVSGTDVYVGGGFTTAGGNPANHIAKWNGSTWSALGSGVGDWVYTIAISGSDVYVGGGFTTAGGNPANYIAKWSGSAWSALGSGVNDWVKAIAVSGSEVYVGGDFATAYIAKWNGSAWSALGSGVNTSVTALAVSGTDVYVGGWFTTAGGNPANYIAKWNGSTWSALGSGVGNTIYAIAVSGSDVYVGGAFTTAGGNPANRIAKWNGSAWSALGGGTSDAVLATAVNPNAGTMMVGGAFVSVDGSVTATCIACFTDSNNPLPVELTSFTASVAGKNVSLQWNTATEMNNYGFEVERTPLASPLKEREIIGGWNKVGFVNGKGTTFAPQGYSFNDAVAEAGKYLYRLKQIDRDGRFVFSKEMEATVVFKPAECTLAQNYPNPFNPITYLRFAIADWRFVTLKVFDVLGREVATLVNIDLPAGEYSFLFDGKNLSSGVYIYCLRAGNFVQIKQMVLAK